MKHVSYYYTLFFLFPASCFFFISSCKKDDQSPTNENALALTPLALDLSYFEKQNDDSSHYNNALRSLAFWQTALNDSLALQKELYNTALNLSFEKQNEETRLVSCELSIKEKIYTVNLFNILKNDTIWIKMFVNQDTLYQDFLMIDGYESKISGEKSLLIYKKSADNKAVKMMLRQSNAEKGRAIYTNLMQGMKNGHYLESKDSIDGNYNKYLKLYDKTSGEKEIIQWNTNSKEGRMQSKPLYQDEQWKCWNADRKDQNCP
ncbi:MAG: hypothetical protein CSB06_03585 [Bacteroidia bacterium]|nr:MAG: hypothetical protein CSB06_03585 [Bacteroidia bacterium]